MKILVHIHIYYISMWEELRSCLNNIENYPYDLYITMLEDSVSLNEHIQLFCPQAKILLVKNRGFDVGPFIEVVNKVNLDDYTHIIKLHTKRNLQKTESLHGHNVSGALWRNYSLNFMSTPDKFKLSVQLLMDNEVAMLSDFRLIVKREQDNTDNVAKDIAEKLIKDHNFPQIDYSFVAGTMFIAKAEIFKPLQNMFSLSDFDVSAPQQSGLAHALERFFGYLVYYNHKKIAHTSSATEVFFITISKYYWRIMHFIYQDRITKSGKRLIKICKIPVWWKKK